MRLFRLPSVIQNRNFRRLYLSTAASQVGMQVSMVGISLTAILVLEASEFEIGVLNSMTFFAMLIFGLPAGVWIDRISRRQILIIADLARFLVLVTVTGAWLLDVLTIWDMYAVVFIVGAATVFFDVAYASFVPNLVDRQDLTSANSSIQGMHSISFMAGPALGGVVIAVSSEPLSVLLAALVIGGSVWWTVRISQVEKLQPMEDRRKLHLDIWRGIQFVMRDRIIRAVSLTAAVCNLAVGVFQAMGVVFLARELQLSSTWVGVVLAGAGVGGVIGAFFAPRISKQFGLGRAACICLAISGPAMALIPFAQADWRLAFGIVGQILYAAAITLFNINTLTYRQAITPDALLGRVNATMRVLAWGSMPIGALVGGLVGEIFDARTALWVASGILSVGFIPIFLTPLRKLREVPTGDAMQVV